MSNEAIGGAGGSVLQAGSIHGSVYVGSGPGPAPLRPRQWPRPPAHWTDRADPAAEIARAAAGQQREARCRIVVVSGPGGVGKTALALHALHQAGGQYPAQLHAALGAHGPAGPARPETVVARWLRAYGIRPQAVPRDPDEAAALFRSVASGSPPAILLDDAADESQVRALLPAAGLVVVTSRRRLAGLAAADGALLLPLGPMDPEAAVELAVAITGRPAERADLETLARYCGRMPLALQAVAARLAARPTVPARAVAIEMAVTHRFLQALDTPSLEVSMTAALSASYEALRPESTARAYRVLAAWPGGDFTAGLAAALLETDEHEAAQALDGLADASLMTETRPGRWRYHDLAREHARERARRDGEQEASAAIARGIHYYLRGSARADMAILGHRLRTAPAFALPSREAPAFGSAADALAWCDAEQDSLLAAQQAAADLGLDHLACQYADTLWGWCSHRADYATWQLIYERAVAAALACGDRSAEVFAAIRLAQCHLGRGDLGAALPIATKAVLTAWASGDPAAEASACEHAGICAARDQRPEDAIVHYKRALACWRRATTYPRGEAIVHRHYGRALHALGRPNEGNEHLSTALSLFTALGETYHRGRTMHVLATYKPPAEAAAAIALLEEARPLLESQDHPLAVSELLTALARAHMHAGDTARASELAGEAAALHRQLGLAEDHPACEELAGIASELPGPAA